MARDYNGELQHNICWQLKHMFTFEQYITASGFISQQSTGFVSCHPEASVCLVGFDKSCYNDVNRHGFNRHLRVI